MGLGPMASMEPNVFVTKKEQQYRSWSIFSRIWSARNTRHRDDNCRELAGVVSMPQRMFSQSTNFGNQQTTADRHNLPFADDGQIAVVLLTQWLDWVTQKN